jgi:modification methylase
MLIPGQYLFFNGDKKIQATIKSDGNLLIQDFVGSIHQTARHLVGDKPSNGWQHWYYENEDGELQPIDELREKYSSLYHPDSGG